MDMKTEGEGVSKLEMVAGVPRIALQCQGEGAALVFLHGIGGNRHNWLAQQRELGAHYRTVAWDARGYGDSDDYDGPLAFADFSADLLRVLDHLGVERAHLVGLSMGGRIALDFWGRHPSRVASLVLADTSGGMPDSPDKQARIEQVLNERRRPLLQGASPRDLAPVLARTLLSPHAPPDARAQAEASLAALRTGSYLKTLDEVTRYDRFPPFESIGVPTLVINGEYDSIAPPDFGRQVAARIPGGRFALIERAGHLSNIEQPAAFNALLRDFLQQVDAVQRSVHT